MQSEKPKCEICDDIGHYRIDVPFGDPRFGKLIRCQCQADNDAARLQRLSRLTDVERQVTLDMIETEGRPGTAAMVETCYRFIRRPQEIVTIWGGSGNAKTMALQAVVNHFVNEKIEAVYITAFDLISYIRAAFQKSDKNDLEVKDESAWQRLQQFERVQILAIDEFDKINVTAWVREQLTDLIDRRYRFAEDGQAGTLIAMNDDPREQPSWIYSRLSRYRIIHNQDGDMRPVFGQIGIVFPHTGEILE